MIPNRGHSDFLLLLHAACQGTSCPTTASHHTLGSNETLQSTAPQLVSRSIDRYSKLNKQWLDASCQGNSTVLSIAHGGEQQVTLLLTIAIRRSFSPSPSRSQTTRVIRQRNRPGTHQSADKIEAEDDRNLPDLKRKQQEKYGALILLNGNAFVATKKFNACQDNSPRTPYKKK